MSRIVSVLLICELSSAVTGIADEQDDGLRPVPTISDVAIDEQGFRVHRVRSAYQASETLLRVLLPDKLPEDQRLKVLYVLPVEARTESRYGDGLVEAKKLDLANKHRLICVAPTFSHLPWYADHATDPTIRQESYLLKVVLPTIDRLYPTLAERDGRLSVGFSKSGYGAWSLLLRNPQSFSKAAAWDAPLMQSAPDRFGMGPIYGTVENFERYRLDRLVRDFAADQHRIPNAAANARLIHLGYGNFRDHHQQIEALLAQLGIKHIYVDGPQREHTWHSGWLEQAVSQLVK